ncbi:MAG TPA: neutral zinc metallopeptidase [Bryobacteraceae bacterium]|nr:neutral zinc metallopeptidase [Bryobacteraceae bacterium]
MRWTPGGVSDNIEDQRSGGGGGFGFGGGGARVGLGGLFIAAILSLIFGRDFISPLLTGGGAGPAPSRQVSEERNRAEEPAVQFVSFVLDDAQRTWTGIMGPQYQAARLVLFRDAVQSACGAAGAETGPFYCPGDQKLYLDLSFFDELDRRFGAPGDFAQAYVIAHEIGHHVQTLMGISRKVRQAQSQNPGAANDLSVRMELQADCFAGVWGNSANQRGHLEAGDAEEGLAAAAAVGDDRIQKRARGSVNPESFTHGSADQRMRWFRRGFDSGDIRQCDTFSGR